MARKLVVFARDDDLHVDAVLSHCHHAGIETIRIDVRELIGGGVSLYLELGAGPHRSVITSGSHFVTNTDQVVVFCRDFELPSVGSTESINECVAFEEARSVLNGWASSIPRRQWVDHPVIQAEFDNKPLQLRIAQQIGLRIPKTLITNEPDAAREFASAQPTVIKQLSNLSFIGMNQTNECIYSTHVEQSV